MQMEKFYRIVNVNAFDSIERNLYESRQSKLKSTTHIIINIKKRIIEDCEKQDAK